MRKFNALAVSAIVSVAIGGIASSCGGGGGGREVNATNDSITGPEIIASAHDSICLDLADAEICVYSGTVAGGWRCRLTIESPEFSGDGIFSIILTAGGDSTSVSGRRYTLRGVDDAVIWNCVGDDGKTGYYFWRVSDDEVYYIPNEDSRVKEYPMTVE